MKTEELVVVINHFEKNVDWVKDLKYPHVIYNKNPEHNHLFEINLPNVGFDTIVYLSYIVEHYDNLPDYICFLQDDPFYHCGNAVEIVNTFNFSKEFYPMGCTYLLGNHDWEKTLNYADQIGLHYTEPLKMINACQCIVSKNLIVKTSKEMYKKIISTIEHTVKCEENYCIENLWPTILNFNEQLEPSFEYCHSNQGGNC